MAFADFRTVDAVEGIRQQRRLSQPAAGFRNYSANPIRTEPVYRGSSVSTEPVYRRSSVSTEPVYRRSSVSTEPVYNRSDLNTKPEERTSRRGSDADDINWIQKYKKSDHHTDRLVSAKLEQEKALGKSLHLHNLDEKLMNHQRIATTFNKPYVTPVSQLHPTPSSHHHYHPQQQQLEPFRYEGTNRLTVFLQPPSNYSPSSSNTKTYEPERMINQRLTQHGDVILSPHTSSGRSTFTLLPPPPDRAAAGSFRSDYTSRLHNHRRSSSDHVVNSLSQSSLYRRRNSIDTSCISARATSRPSNFSQTIDRSFSPATITHPPPPPASESRSSFARAPSLPPDLSRTSSSFLAGTGSFRSSFEGSRSDAFRRRSSVANVSDFSTHNYRSGVDVNRSKGALSVDARIRNAHLSAAGSDHLRRGSYEATLSPVSSLSPLSPLSPLQPSSLPPPSERIFGHRTTHSSIRRIRRSLADS